MPTVNMTEQWIEKVELPEQGRVEWFDRRTGLGLRVSHNGKKRWFVRYKALGEGTHRRIMLNLFPQMTLKMARQEAIRVIFLTQPLQDDEPDDRTWTFEAMAAEYLERYAKVRKRSWREDEKIINKDLLPIFGRRLVSEIQRRDIVQMLDAIADRGAPILSNRTLVVIRKMFNWAISRDIAQFNPCSLVKPVAPNNFRDRVLTESEIRRIWLAINSQGQIIGTLFKLRLLTAQRGREVQQMRWADIDWSSRIWTIPAHVSKNKRSHRVPLSEPVIELLQRLTQLTSYSEWVFASKVRKGRPLSNANKNVGEVRQAAAVTDFVMHDFRRTAATHMTALGIQRIVVSKILNHAEAGITRIYDRYSYDKEKREALEKWADHLKQIVFIL